MEQGEVSCEFKRENLIDVALDVNVPLTVGGMLTAIPVVKMGALVTYEITGTLRGPLAAARSVILYMKN